MSARFASLWAAVAMTLVVSGCADDVRNIDVVLLYDAADCFDCPRSEAFLGDSYTAVMQMTNAAADTVLARDCVATSGLSSSQQTLDALPAQLRGFQWPGVRQNEAEIVRLELWVLTGGFNCVPSEPLPQSPILTIGGVSEEVLLEGDVGIVNIPLTCGRDLCPPTAQ